MTVWANRQEQQMGKGQKMDKLNKNLIDYLLR